ncbi:MAG: hypothetical protein ACP5K1_01415 [Candidatus Bathyarchaeia archaeon]
MDRVKELFEKVGSKCIGEFGGSGIAPKLKIYFGGVDALWISEGEAKVRGVEEGGFYKFWEASEFSEYAGPEEMLGDESRMAEAESIELICGEQRRSFNSWREFIQWLKDE